MRKALERVYNSKKTTVFLKTVSHVSSLASVLAYAYILILGYLQEWTVAVKLILFSAIPFVLVSLVRRIINAERPYEKYSFYEIKPKSKKGRSFPSRHVFSAFIIATLACMFSPVIAVVLFVLGAALAASRVLLGMHYISDVVFGALIGVFSGILAIILI